MAKDKIIEKIQDLIEEVAEIDRTACNLLDEAEKLPDDKLAIKDVSKFKYLLEVENLMTPQLEAFINEYLRWYNTNPGRHSYTG